MWPMIKAFFCDKETAKPAMKIGVSLLCSALLAGAFDVKFTEWGMGGWLAILVGLATAGNALLAGSGRKRKNGK